MLLLCPSDYTDEIEKLIFTNMEIINVIKQHMKIKQDKKRAEWINDCYKKQRKKVAGRQSKSGTMNFCEAMAVLEFPEQ